MQGIQNLISKADGACDKSYLTRDFPSIMFVVQFGYPQCKVRRERPSRTTKKGVGLQSVLTGTQEGAVGEGMRV